MTTPAADSAAADPPPCRFAGRRLPLPGAVREWRECRHPETPLGSPVCVCKGCGPTCRGYEPGEAED